jgi:hypothetical protein
MKRILITILLSIVVIYAFGQKAKIDTLLIPTHIISKDFAVSELKFPLINTGNSKIDRLINDDLTKRFTGNQFPSLTIDSMLLSWVNQSIAFLDFVVTYNRNGLVSLNITAEGCGANCTSWTNYFTYCLITGKLITINEVIALTDSVRYNINSEKDKQFSTQKSELKKIFLSEESEIDYDTYSLALEYYKTCNKSFEINDFALFEDYIQIIHECELPRMIRHLAPTITLKLTYDEIKEALIIKS